VKKISIIIPCKTLKEAEKCIYKCLELQYPNFEIIILTDQIDQQNMFNNNIKVRIINTGPVNPSIKRNIGVANSTGEIIAFIDSDAYPEQNWLNTASKWFDSDNHILVGGPDIVPPDSNIMQRLVGYILGSYSCGGTFAIRQGTKKYKEIQEIGSCNMFIRKEDFVKANGFNPDYNINEDSEFCFRIKKMDMKIIFDPSLFVWHRKRNLFIPHLKRIFIYGYYKPKILLKHFSIEKLFYTIPSLLIFCFIFSIFIPVLRIPIFLYLGFVILESIYKNILFSPIIMLGIISTVIVYGVAFVLGAINELFITYKINKESHLEI